mmetsp:Transcript_38050/g.91284  ORF Transcript_38050/g.91284 Transcript_38050/m.91284 type:complete len:222 (-) Transcript_38050:12-677(-)
MRVASCQLASAGLMKLLSAVNFTLRVHHIALEIVFVCGYTVLRVLRAAVDRSPGRRRASIQKFVLAAVENVLACTGREPLRQGGPRAILLGERCEAPIKLAGSAQRILCRLCDVGLVRAVGRIALLQPQQLGERACHCGLLAQETSVPVPSLQRFPGTVPGNKNFSGHQRGEKCQYTVLHGLASVIWSTRLQGGEGWSEQRRPTGGSCTFPTPKRGAGPTV